MLASTSGRSIFGLRIDPRSPPVQVTTCTSTPSATYFAVEAAPLLDSSSGWACTCIRRSMAIILEMRELPVVSEVRTDPMAGRYGGQSPRRRRAVILASGVVGVLALAWLAWAGWSQSTPDVQSNLQSFEVVDTHSVEADRGRRHPVGGRHGELPGPCLRRGPLGGG